MTNMVHVLHQILHVKLRDKRLQISLCLCVKQVQRFTVKFKLIWVSHRSFHNIRAKQPHQRAPLYMKCSTPCPAERPPDIHRKADPKDCKDLTTASRVFPASRGKRQAPVWASQAWVSKAWANQAWVSPAWVSKAWASQGWASQAWASKAWASQVWVSKAWEWAPQACLDPVRA